MRSAIAALDAASPLALRMASGAGAGRVAGPGRAARGAAAGVVVLLGAAVLAGCGGEEKPAPELRPLAVRDQVSSIIKTGDSYLINWAGVLGNDNKWHFGEQVVATITGQNAAGKQVVRTDQPLDAVPPAGALPFSGQAVSPEKPEKVTITFRPAQWRKASRVTSAFRPFPVSDSMTTRQNNGNYIVTGRVANPYNLSASSLVVTALLRDKMGKLVGGGTTFVDDVASGVRPRFILSVEGLPKSAQVARTEVVARTWGSTGKPYEDLVLGGAKPLHTVKPTTAPFPRDRGRQALPIAP
ncbi:hypothetical protein [Sinosporangium siamense]|uniref:hypothetical protein n=1 Tax=Sinosporangium siamense TaxID=1367973 RepID=UPI001EF1B545|nr:hypothetical protein [Sinosporangium siamense]